jgi:hypothetical protein
MTDRIVSVSRIIPADAATIFALLSDPRRHAEIDGSDMVQAAKLNAPDRLTMGATFGMDMRFLGFLPYKISNEVVEFEEDRRIAWRHFGHHIWRYVLEPVDEASTNVTESFEWGTARLPIAYQWAGYPKAHLGNMTRTLEKLEQVLTAP